MRAYMSLRYVILHVTSKGLGSTQHIQNITVSLLLQHFLLGTCIHSNSDVSGTPQTLRFPYDYNILF